MWELKSDSLDDLPEGINKKFHELCEMAYNGVETGTIIFDLEPDFDTLGLLQGVESLTDHRTVHLYNFHHLSIQELLAAIFVARLEVSKQVEQFERLFHQANFSSLLQFYAAKTKLQRPGIKQIVIDIVKKRAKEVTLLPHDSTTSDSSKSQPLLLSLLRCLYEAQSNGLCELVVEQLTDLKLDLSNISLNPADCLAVGFFLTHCRQFELYMAWCSIDEKRCKTLFRLEADLRIIEYVIVCAAACECFEWSYYINPINQVAFITSRGMVLCHCSFPKSLEIDNKHL